MKTSVAKKLRDRVLAAFLAIAVMLSYVLPSAITASAATNGNIDGSGLVDVTGSNLQLQNEYGGWVDVNEYGTTNFGNTGVQFQFNWTLDQDFVDKLVSGDVSVPVTLEVDLSEQLHDINITTKDEHSVSNGKGLTGSYRFEGQKVYITINTISKDDEQSGNTQHYGGGGLVTGELELNEEEIPSTGEVEVEFFDKTYKAVYTPKTGKMYVEKSFSKTHYDPAEDAFYADFTVNVGSWSDDLSDITITDTFKSGDDCFYADDEMHDVTVTMPDGTTYPLGDKKSGEKFELGDEVKLNQGERATVTYSIKIDPEKQSSYEEKANNVEATADDGSKSAKGSANANAALPTVDKSGSMAEGSDSIKWTIRVYLNILGSEGVPDDRKTFTVTDTPDGNIKDALAKVDGVIDNGNGTYEIPIDLFDDKGNGVFEYTYETPLDESVLSSATDTRVTNHVTVEFPKIVNDKYTVDKDGELTVKGVGVGAIDKEFVEILSGGRISWKVDVTLPDADMASLKLTDTTTKWDNKYLKHKVILDTLKINGEPYSQACKEREWYGDSDPYCNVYETGMEFELSPEFLAKHKGETVTITYQTQAVDASGNKITNIDPKMYIYNKAQFDLELSGETTPIVKYDEYEKVPQFDISKTYESEWSLYGVFDLTDLAYPLLWRININGLNSIEDTLKVGDKFTIVDTLPEYFVVDKYVWSASSSTYGSATYAQDITAVQEKGSRQVVFTVTVSEDMLAKLKETADPKDGTWHLWLAYSTYVPKDLEQEAQMEYYRPNENVQVTNTADVSFNNEPVASDVTANQNIVIENPKILNKSLLTEAVETEVVDGEIRYFVTYEVKINENGVIIGDVDKNGEPLLKELEAVDNLGYGLTFGKVLSGIEDVYVKVNKQQITFILENKKAYDIVYKVYIDRAGLNEKVTDADQRFANVVRLEGSNNAAAKNTVRMNSGTYRSNFFIYADSANRYLTVQGTKMWENMDGNATPKEITLKLTKRNSITNDVVGDPIIYKIGTGDDCDYNCIVDGDTWTFTIPKLITYDGENSYKYDIEEITVNGYAVSYEGTHTDLTNDSNDENEIIKVVPLAITNTREEVKPETVDISINKVWVGGEGGNTSVTVTLSGTDGYSKDYTITKADGWKLIVNDLPKYDSEGNEIIYSVTEKNVEHYTSRVTKNSKYSFTVTNTVEKTNISITKVWNGGEGGNTSVMVTLSGTDGYSKDYEIKAADGWKLIVNDLPKYDSEGNEITYSVTEKNVEHYTSAVTKNSSYSFTVTNTVEKTNVSITKVWNGGEGGNTSVMVTLSGTDGYSKDYEIKAADGWKLTVKDLPKYDSEGNEITYSVTEKNVDHYTSRITKNGNSFSVINTVEKTNVSITKVWNGGEGGNTSVMVTLSGTDGYSKDYEIKAADGWKLTVKDLPKYDSEGNEITYSVTEKNVDHYTSRITKNGNSFSVINTVEKISISITKVWNGGEGGNTSVMVTLSGTDGYSKDYEIKAADGWKLIVNDLPKYDSEGKEIIYSVTEKNVEHYTSRVTKNSNSFTVTNTVEKTNVSITKVWNGGTDRPDVTVTLNGTDGYSKDFILNAANDWTVTEKDLPKYDEKGNEIKYTVTEAAVTGYTSEVTNVGYDFTVTNTYKTTPQQPEEPKPTKVQISKQDITTGKELPGAHLKVVDENGNTVAEFDSTDKPTYFEAKFEAGKTYTLIEETAPDGYVKAEAVEFTVNADGTVTQVVMKDDTTKVSISKKDITGDEELAGAQLQVLDKDGNVVDSWVSTDKPHDINGVLKAGEKYTLHEEAAPNGYAYASDVEFTVNKDGTVTQVVMKDDTTKVSISKKDITGDEELAGAKLQVLDKDGNVVDSWVSTDKPHDINGVLKAGEKYTLHEEVAPDGYAYASDVEFTVNKDGTITQVVMKDDTTKVQISKKDITGGKELPGAHLKVVDENGNTVAEFDSTDEPTYFEAKFEAGKTYTLIEETAPNGYVVAEEVKFTVSKDGNIDVVEMVDDTTKVQISKQDLTTGKELAGAKLKVVDKDGNVIKEWTSTDKPAYFENVFKAGETYTLIEETAPDGYVKAEAVEFTVNADGTVTQVVMKDDTTKVSISKKDITGDEELAGAQLQVLDKDGNVVDSWVSTDKPHDINGVLVAGEKYTLHEEVAPDGYKVANDIEFVVNADGTVTKVTMIDEAKNGTDLDGDSNDKDSGVAQGGGSNDKDTDNDESPKTGDSGNVTLIMLALALGVMAVTNKKRRNN